MKSKLPIRPHARKRIGKVISSRLGFVLASADVVCSTPPFTHTMFPPVYWNAWPIMPTVLVWPLCQQCRSALSKCWALWAKTPFGDHYNNVWPIVPQLNFHAVVFRLKGQSQICMFVRWAVRFGLFGAKHHSETSIIMSGPLCHNWILIVLFSSWVDRVNQYACELSSKVCVCHSLVFLGVPTAFVYVSSRSMLIALWSETFGSATYWVGFSPFEIELVALCRIAATLCQSSVKAYPHPLPTLNAALTEKGKLLGCSVSSLLNRSGRARTLSWSGPLCHWLLYKCPALCALSLNRMGGRQEFCQVAANKDPDLTPCKRTHHSVRPFVPLDVGCRIIYIPGPLSHH